MKIADHKTHYKMYKTHRGWIFAGITATSIALSFTWGPHSSQTAHAATTDSEATQTTITSQSDTADKEVSLPTSSSTSLNKQENNSPTNSSVNAPTVESTTTPSSKSDSETSVTDSTTNQASTHITSNIPSPTTDNKQVPTSETSNSSDLGTTKSVSATDASPVSTTTNNTTQAATPVTSTTPTRRATEKASNLVVSRAAAPVSQTTIKPGINVQDTTTLTDPITGKTSFNISKTTQLQYTYDHTDANGISSDLRVVDGYNAKYQSTNGAKTWLGLSYATSIAADAKGEDTNSPLQYGDGSHPFYIDEWLPDYALQYVLWENNFISKYSTIAAFRANFTKSDLATLTSFNIDSKLQYTGNYNNPTPTTFFMAMMSMKTLEGLQNATNLKTIDITPEVNVNMAQFGNYTKNGNLWDIRALKDLTSLTSVSIQMFSINDISALADKPNLTRADLSYNQISDISPLATNPGIDLKNVSLSQQHILLRPITLNTSLGKGQNTSENGTLTYTTPSFIIKNLTAANLPIRGFNNDEGALYPSLYPSTADSGNNNYNTLSWYNLLSDTNSQYGSLSTTWSDPDSSFGGWIIQPYALTTQASSLVVNLQLLQADGQQLTLGPTRVITGNSGEQIVVSNDATLQTLLNQEKAKGYRYAMILDGTGSYADYIANNGRAHLVYDGSTDTWNVTLADDAQNWTILLYKDVLPWHVSMHYGYSTDGTNLTQMTDSTGEPITEQYTGTSENVLALKAYQKDFPDYVYVQTLTGTDGVHWTPVTNANLSFSGANQLVLFMYTQAKRATVTLHDATTDTNLQTALDYTTNPELRGAYGTTSSFDSAALIAAYQAKGYVLISDDTKTATGTSAIKFNATDPAVVNYTITFQHRYTATVKTIRQNIAYVDQNATAVHAANTQQVSFATIVDQVTHTTATYWNTTTTTPPELSLTGVPVDTSWHSYPTTGVTFSAVTNPIITGMRVVTISNGSSDLSQVAAHPVSLASPDQDIIVSYAHNFEITRQVVGETVHYQDLTGTQVALDYSQQITFATITDQTDQSTQIFYHLGTVAVPSLDLLGQPTDNAWQLFTQALEFKAVTHPVVANMHVNSNSDSDGDLQQVASKLVSPTTTSDALTFTVRYAHDFDVTTNQVHQTIHYADATTGKTAFAPVKQSYTFAQVTDLSAPDQLTYYVYTGATTAPTLNVNGVSTTAGWQAYQPGTTLTLPAVLNPTQTGFTVLTTTDPANDLTQVTSQHITNTSPDLDFTVTYGHEFSVTANPVTQTITYWDQTAKQVAFAPVQQTITFIKVTDQANGQVQEFSHVGNVTLPELSVTGIPTTAGWTIYTPGTALMLAAVANPTGAGRHVLATTDPANDLTQITAQAVTSTSTDHQFKVTYVHDFDVTTNQVSQTISYLDQTAGGTVVNPITQTISFANIVDRFTNTNQWVVYHGTADAPDLDAVTGQPTSTSWQAYTVGTPVTLAAVTNPAKSGYYVVSTTDPANDLTQVTAQTVTNTATDLNFIVNYAHIFDVTTKPVTETITYWDQTANQTAFDAFTQAVTFVQVKDQADGTVALYQHTGNVAAPELTLAGAPIASGWQTYFPGETIDLAARSHPLAPGLVILTTTDPTGDLTEVAPQAVTNTTPDFTVKVTYAHTFTTTTKQVNETIYYLDKTAGGTLFNPTIQTVSFATITDQYTHADQWYIYQGATTAPTLDAVTGRPTITAWQPYTVGDPITLAAVPHPTKFGYTVVTTTDPANDLMQITPQTVTNDSTNVAFTVGYAHDFAVATNAVTETIYYWDQTAQRPAFDDFTQAITFMRVHDLANNTVTWYQHAGNVATAELTSMGTPIEDGWTSYLPGTNLTLTAHLNPTATGLTVRSTTDAANDLTQTTVQAITNTSADLSFKVSYVHDFKVATNQVKETIHYLDATTGGTAFEPTTQNITFATVTDIATDAVQDYVYHGETTIPVIDTVTGQPIAAGWTATTATTPVSFDAVKYPQRMGLRLIATDEPTGDLSQIAAQSITQNSADLTFNVTYAHVFESQVTPISQTVHYQDLNGQPVAADYTATITFLTVNDQLTGTQTLYSYHGNVSAPTLDFNGQPTVTGWTSYTPASDLSFVAVTNPTVTGMHVVQTTDPANDLTQTVAQPVHPTNPATTVTVTYAHDYTATVKTVTETVHYQNQAGQLLAPTSQQAVTFLTVTDQSNQQTRTYVHEGTQLVPELTLGQPTTAGWQLATTATLPAITLPVITGWHVVATTSGSDLTSITTQTVTPTSTDLVFNVTYAENSTGDNGDGTIIDPPTTNEKPTPEKPLAPKPDQVDPAPEQPEQPDKRTPTTPVPSTPTPAKSAKTITPIVTPAANQLHASQPVIHVKSAPVGQQLPQTDEQSRSGIMVLGLTLLSTLLGLGYRKRH